MALTALDHVEMPIGDGVECTGEKADFRGRAHEREYSRGDVGRASGEKQVFEAL